MSASPRLGPTTVRGRATAAATVIVASALLVGAAVLLLVLRAELTREVDNAALGRVQDLLVLARSGALPPALTAPADDTFAQVVDESGGVVATSRGAFTARRVTTFVPPGTAPSVETVPRLLDGDEYETYRVWAARTATPSGDAIVYVGTDVSTVGDALGTVGIGLAVGVPLLTLLVSLTTWTLIGRALRPVDAVRAEVDAITARDLTRRVPEPNSADEIGRLARTMNTMLDRLDQAAHRQRNFVADASHELQSPLTALRAQLETARADPATDWPVTSGQLLAVTAEMDQLVHNLLYLARLDHARTDRQADTELDLDDVVLEEAARCRGATAVAVDTTRVSAAPMRGTRDDLARLVRNVLDNAVRYADTRVTVSLAAVDGVVELAVEDDGPGIPAADRERVFGRFVRLDSSRSRGAGGTGLGLAIARAIAEAHDGTVTIGSPARGTRVVITLPHDLSDSHGAIAL